MKMAEKMTGTMETSRLVQRLHAPYPAQSDTPSLVKLGETFAFGGGLRNGGLSDNAMDLLRGIFSFDYMGAAEFEWGAVPTALRRIAGNADSFIAFAIPITLATVAKSMWDKSEETPQGGTTVKVTCHRDQREEVTSRIRGWAANPHDDKLKEMTMLSDALRPGRPRRDYDVCGWLELDNGFFFFTNREMFEKTAALFGIATDPEQTRKKARRGKQS